MVLSLNLNNFRTLEKYRVIFISTGVFSGILNVIVFKRLQLQNVILKFKFILLLLVTSEKSIIGPLNKFILLKHNIEQSKFGLVSNTFIFNLLKSVITLLSLKHPCGFIWDGKVNP